MKENNKKELQKSEVGKPILAPILSGKVALHGVNDFEKLKKLRNFDYFEQKKEQYKRDCEGLWLVVCSSVSEHWQLEPPTRLSWVSFLATAWLFSLFSIFASSISSLFTAYKHTVQPATFCSLRVTYVYM